MSSLEQTETDRGTGSSGGHWAVQFRRRGFVTERVPGSGAALDWGNEDDGSGEDGSEGGSDSDQSPTPASEPSVTADSATGGIDP